MTLKDLLDAVDHNRDRDDVIRIMDCNGEAAIRAITSWDGFDEIEEREIECLAASGEGVMDVWLKENA